MACRRRCPNGARPSASRASAKRSACTSPAIRSPNTSASCGRSPAGASPTLAARKPVGTGGEDKGNAMAHPGPQRDRRRARARDPQARRAHQLHPRRSQRPARGHDVRGRLPAVPRRWSRRTRSSWSRAACAGTTSSTTGGWARRRSWTSTRRASSTPATSSCAGRPPGPGTVMPASSLPALRAGAQAEPGRTLQRRHPVRDGRCRGHPAVWRAVEGAAFARAHRTAGQPGGPRRGRAVLRAARRLTQVRPRRTAALQSFPGPV